MYYGQANYGIFRCRGKIAPQTAHHHQQAAPYIILIDNFNDALALLVVANALPHCTRLHRTVLILDILYNTTYMVERVSRTAEAELSPPRLYGGFSGFSGEPRN